MQRMTARLLTALLLVAGTFCSAQKASLTTQQDPRFALLPLTFEENRGQVDPAVKFLSRGRGFTAYLNAGGMVLSLHPASVSKDKAQADSMAPQNHKAVLEFKLVGAAANAQSVGENPLPGRVNYFFGNDKSKWRTNVATYQSVRYQNIYPGIDLIYYGNHGKLEYDFAVAPNGNPDRIQFEVKGADHLEVDADGNLLVKVAGGELQFRRPTIYQLSNGVRVPVEGGYSIKSATRVGFQIATFDPKKPLVIDPVLLYSSYLGGSGNDQPTSIAVDSTGNIYVAGYTDSTDFPQATFGSLPPGSDHIFVTKFDPTGSTLIYSDYIGGNNQDYADALTLDSANEVYLTGSTASSDFPMVNAYQAVYPGSFNAFVTKIAANGASLLYSTYLGGNGSDVPSGIKLDSSSNILVAGTTSSTNFPVANAYQASAAANQGGLFGNYGFITKLTSDGSSLVYSTYFGGSSNIPYDCGTPCWPQPASSITGIALDTSDNAYITGTTNTYDFPATSGVYLATNTTQLNASVGFIAKMGPAGTLQYSSYFYESSGFTNINAIAVDGLGSAFVTGASYSDGTFPLTSTSICDPGTSGVACSYAFVTKFDPTATTLTYSTFLGANNYANPVAIAIDKTGDAYVLTTTSSSSFATVNGIQPYAGGNDLLLAEVDPVAGSELFATYLGGTADETATAMTIASDGSLYLTGTTTSTDMPLSQLPFQAVAAGNADGFVIKLGAPPAPIVSLNPTSLTFSAQQVGTTSAAKQVTLQNTGNAALTITSISATGDFAVTNNCGASVAASGSCALSVKFTPVAAGQRSGSVSVTDNAAGSPHTITLSGSGTAPADFSLTGTTTSVTVKAGTTATYSLTLAPVGGAFSNQVQLACSGGPANSTCSVSPTSATPGSNSSTVTVTVGTKASSAAVLPIMPRGQASLYAAWMQFPGMGVLGLLLLGGNKKKRLNLILLSLMLCGLFFMTACAGGTGIVSQGGGTAPGTYTLTVTATSGSLHHSLPLTLIVQ